MRATLFMLAAATALGGPVMAQEPDARTSDPVALGWMQGFPPPEDRLIRVTDPDWARFPKLRWSVCHFRQLMPNVAVDRGADAARPLPQALDPGIDAVSFTPLGGDRQMTWAEAFDANFTDGLIVLHHGQVVYERLAGCLEPDGLHGVMSVTKSLTGLLAEILVAEGRLDPSARMADLIPALAESGFADATLRQVMDMTTAIRFSEDYADPEAEIWAFAQAGSTLPAPAGQPAPGGYLNYLTTIRKDGTHGEAFGYRTVNADALGWVISRVTGQSVAELLSDRIWSRIGARREAFYTVDSRGTPFAGGGFNASLQDLARLGQLMLDGGQVDGRQIVPPAAIEAIRHGGDPAKFAKAGYALLPGWSYSAMWWLSNDDHGAYAARGVHGQTIWIDPAADMVIVRLASNPVAANAANDPTSLPAYRAVADYLMAHDPAPLLGAEWVIEDIAGGGIIDNTRPSLKFLPDGRLAGNATCNRIIGQYAGTGTQLTITPGGSTMMACPEALMNQERKLLDLLPRITGFELDETGALILTGPEGPVLKARR